MSRITNLSNFVGNGYNLTENNFTGSPIFKLSYGEQDPVQWGESEVEIPDQISLSVKNTSINMTSDESYANVAEFQSKFATSISVEYSGFTYSGSAEANYRSEDMSKTDTSSRYFTGYYVAGLGQFERLARSPGEGFSSTFKSEFQALLAGYENMPYSEIERFLKKYGTHFLSSCYIGGHASVYISVDTSEVEASSFESFEGKVSAEMDAMFAKGSVSAELMKEESSFLQEYSSATSVKVSSFGGGDLDKDGGNLSEWHDSIFNTPQVIIASDHDSIPPAKLLSISQLVPEFVDEGTAATVKSWLDNQICKYLLKEALKKEGASVFLPGFPIESQTQRNWGPALLAANFKSKENGDNGYIVGVGDPEAGTFGTVRAGGSVDWFWMNFPVKTKVNDLAYDCCLLPTGSSVASSFEALNSDDMDQSFRAYSILDPGELSLGAWEDLTEEIKGKEFAEITPDSDGFLVGTLDAREAFEGDTTDAGSTLKLMEGEITGNTTDLTGCSQYFAKKTAQFKGFLSSFVSPVRKGVTYTVKTTNEVADVRLMFMPLGETFQIGAPVAVTSNDSATEAPTDGILTAYFHIDKSDQDDLAMDGYIRVSEQSSTINDDNKVVAKTSVTYKDVTVIDVIRDVATRTATIPVSKGEYYRVTVGKSSGTDDPSFEKNATVFWHPITVAD